MSTIRFIGKATTVAQVDTFTPANVEVDDVFTLTITGVDGSTHSVSFTATAGTVANVTEGLAAAWNAETNALCAAITAADETTYLTLTADTAGVGFSVAATTTDGGGTNDQTLTRSVTTANSGPKDWSCADNWSGGAVPGGAASQDVIVEGAEILYGLDQSGISETLDSLTIINSQIGSNPATGYLPVYLQIKTSKLYIGRQSGPGTVTEDTPVLVDTGSTACDCVVYNSGVNSTSTMPAVRLLADSDSSTLKVNGGIVGIALISGETGQYTSISSKGTLYVGSGLTLGTLNIQDGTGQFSCSLTALNQYDGTLTSSGSGTITTATIYDGDFISNSTGTITLLNNISGDVNMLQSSEARTISELKMGHGAIFKYDPAVVELADHIKPYLATQEIKIKAETV